MFKYKQKNIIIIGLIVLLAIFVILSQKNKNNSPSAPKANQSKNLVTQDQYPQVIKSWLEKATNNKSVVTIAEIKKDILNLKGASQDMGPTQINLYLAFDAWEKYLNGGEYPYSQLAQKNFEAVATKYPQLDPQIKQLIKIIP